VEAFISHSSSNTAIALRLANVLREEGIQPWVASERLNVGESIHDAIVKAIDSCDVIVFIVGVEPPGQWQEQERQLAVAATWRSPAKAIVPVALPNARFPSFLANWVGLRLSPEPSEWTSAFRRLALDLKVGKRSTAKPDWEGWRRRLTDLSDEAERLPSERDSVSE
jgi:TIR domain